MPRFVIIRLEVPDRIEHLAGQHYVVRLTAPDGYTAQRSYSIASAPGSPFIELAIERLTDGEVSGYLADVVQPGDQLDVRGPIGGWFVWRGDTPVVGLGGGTGVVPFLSMLRHSQAVGATDLLRLAVSARTREDLLYADELEKAGALIALTRVKTYVNQRPPGRLNAGDVLPLVTPDATGFVCGSAAFAESGSVLLMQAGLPASSIRVERFGPTA
jgi:ferredoxin-NADP reductase